MFALEYGSIFSVTQCDNHLHSYFQTNRLAIKRYFLLPATKSITGGSFMYSTETPRIFDFFSKESDVITYQVEKKIEFK